MITVTKTIPTTSARYTGGGAVTITFSGANSITINSKKTLIKVNSLQGKGTWTAAELTSSTADFGKNYVVDLKNVTDNFKIGGWIEDSGTTSALSAWNKAWQLKAMATTGGPVTSLVMENLTFSSATGSQQVFLEEVNLVCHPHPGKTIDATTYKGIARIEIDCNFYLGDQR